MNVTDGESLSGVASRWYDHVNCSLHDASAAENVSIIIVLSLLALLRRQTIMSRLYPTSRSCPLIKTSVRRNLTITIVFDELVVEGEQAAIRVAVCVITRCAVTFISSISSNSNDTASTTGSAEASQFSIGGMAKIAT